MYHFPWHIWVTEMKVNYTSLCILNKQGHSPERTDVISVLYTDFYIFSFRNHCFTAKSGHVNHLDKDLSWVMFDYMKFLQKDDDAQISLSDVSSQTAALWTAVFRNGQPYWHFSLFLCRYCLHRLASKYPLLFALELPLVSIIYHFCWTQGYS